MREASGRSVAAPGRRGDPPSQQFERVVGGVVSGRRLRDVPFAPVVGEPATFLRRAVEPPPD
eukprot:4806763-Lingulodinium_polyedra.AAC.1